MIACQEKWLVWKNKSTELIIPPHPFFIKSKTIELTLKIVGGNITTFDLGGKVI